ncbi:MAG: carbohydrate kinase family protein [Candidatus Pacebacteria bacterium]|nr:carbohydrate kinase family protein [Candidatus Paceibacterota bacterium]
MSFFKKSYDFVAIGDNTTDAFIRLKDAHIIPDDTHDGYKKLCIDFGSKIPYESVEVIHAVGNAANAAVSAARLGLSSALISDTGDDQNGEESLQVFRKNKVSTDFIRVHKGMTSNYDFVLCYDADRTILVKHETYPSKMPSSLDAKWIYLSSFAHKNEGYIEEIMTFIEKNPSVKVAFQPATFEIKAGVPKFARIYKRTEVFICNLEEAETILEKENADPKTLLEGLRALGPKIVVMTDGPAGAYCYDGQEFLKMPIYPDPKPPVQRTGAGDAFASTFVSALALGKSIREALMWGPVNSMSVVQQVGAQKGLLSRDALLKYLAEAPTDYLPTTF